MTKETGTVKTIRSLGAGGGAIFTIANEHVIRPIVIVADYSSYVRLPVWGEMWEIDGVYENHPIHGRQLRATIASPIEPIGQQIVDLLTGHPLFRGIGQRRAKKLWNILGDDLLHSLDKVDLITLTRASLSWPMALNLCRQWRKYKLELQLLATISHLTLSRTSRLHIHQHIPYLCHIPSSDIIPTLTAIQGMPFLLQSASAESHIERPELEGACEGCFVRGGKVVQRSLSKIQMLRKLMTVLHDIKISEHCLDLAITCRRVISVQTPIGEQFLPVGIYVICAALEKNLRSRLQSFHPSPQNVREGHEGPKLLLVRTDGFLNTAASVDLRKLYPDALHVQPLRSACNEARDLSFKEFLSIPSTDLPSTFSTIVFHRSDTYDLLTMAKAVARTPKTVMLVMAGSSFSLEQSRLLFPFHIFLKCSRIPNVALDDIVANKPRQKRHTDFIERTPPDNLSRSFESVIEEVLFLYREYSCRGTTVVLAESALIRHAINSRLVTEEPVQPPSATQTHGRKVLRLASNKEATVGALVTWRGINLAEGRFPGDIGIVTEIYSSPKLRIAGVTPIATYGTVDFSDTGLFQLCQADLDDLTLSYALDLRTAIRGCWDNVIALHSSDRQIHTFWLEIASRLSRKTFTLVATKGISLSSLTSDSNSSNANEAAFTTILTKHMRV